MEKVFAEIGFGNETFLSTEIETGDTEYRLPKFIKPEIVKGYYLRFWIMKHVYIFSTNSGFEMKHKDRNKIKVLFGISGTNT